MRETRSYGSVRGVAGDRHPYRDWQLAIARAGAHSDGRPGDVCRPLRGLSPLAFY